MRTICTAVQALTSKGVLNPVPPIFNHPTIPYIKYSEYVTIYHTLGIFDIKGRGLYTSEHVQLWIQFKQVEISSSIDCAHSTPEPGNPENQGPLAGPASPPKY